VRQLAEKIPVRWRSPCPWEKAQNEGKTVFETEDGSGEKFVLFEDVGMDADVGISLNWLR